MVRSSPLASPKGWLLKHVFILQKFVASSHEELGPRGGKGTEGEGLHVVSLVLTCLEVALDGQRGGEPFCAGGADVVLRRDH
jgi:hypothetical protein